MVFKLKGENFIIRGLTVGSLLGRQSSRIGITQNSLDKIKHLICFWLSKWLVFENQTLSQGKSVQRL